MEIFLNYGKAQLSVTLPDELDVSIIRKPEMPLLDDPAAVLEAAFAAPITPRFLDSVPPDVKTIS